MKKIGILFGQERSFPQAFINKVNELEGTEIVAEFVNINKVFQGEPLGYAVIIDRISQDVPFYRAALKNAAITGTAVINNPFWWSADEKFFNNALALKLGIPVPKTALIPSHARPDDTTAESFSNLAYPLDWQGIFDYVGFPAYMKPFDGGGWKEVYKLEDKEDFFHKHSLTNQYVMMLQEEIVFDEYYRCYCIGGKYVRIMQYEPRNPFHLRYAVDTPPSSEKLLETIHEYVIKLNQHLGYDFNTVEFAVKDGIPYAIDFCNPAPDAEVSSVGQENFDWVVENAAKYAIERAKAQVEGQDNLTWGEYVKSSVGQSAGIPLIKLKEEVSPAAADVTSAKKPAPAKIKNGIPVAVKKPVTKEKKAAAQPNATGSVTTDTAQPSASAGKKTATGKKK